MKTVLLTGIALLIAGCVSTTKELTTTTQGKTYYASEAECPLYLINKDDTVSYLNIL